MADLNYTLDDLTGILVDILQQHGPQQLQVLGQHLQQKTDPSISKYLKSKMGGGLKVVLGKRPQLFTMTGTPPNEVASLAGVTAKRSSQASMASYLTTVERAINDGNHKMIARALKLFGGVQTAELEEEILRV